MIASSPWLPTAWALVGGISAMHLTPIAEHEMTHKPYPRTAALGATMLVFGLLATRAGSQPHLLADSCAAMFGVPLLVIDSATLRLPSSLTTPLLVGVVATSAASAVVDRDAADLLRGLLTMILQGAFYLTLWLAAHGGLGGGDVKLAIPLALACGWHGWPALFLLNAGASIITLIDIALPGPGPRRAAHPLGPGLIVAASVAALVDAS